MTTLPIFRTVLITGALGGIGQATCTAFASPSNMASIGELDRDTWSNILSTNLTAVYRCIQRVTRKGCWGRVVNVSSVHGFVGSVDKAAYVAAKHGVPR